MEHYKLLLNRSLNRKYNKLNHVFLIDCLGDVFQNKVQINLILIKKGWSIKNI